MDLFLTIKPVYYANHYWNIAHPILKELLHVFLYLTWNHWCLIFPSRTKQRYFLISFSWEKKNFNYSFLRVLTVFNKCHPISLSHQICYNRTTAQKTLLRISITGDMISDALACLALRFNSGFIMYSYFLHEITDVVFPIRTDNFICCSSFSHF